MELDEIRKEIDKIDSEMIELASERAKLAHEVSLYKKKNGLPLRNLEREKEVIRMMGSEAASNGLSKEFGEKLAKSLIQEAILIEERELKK